ncbi:UNC93-like protein MFSD11 [Orchesella cincta]|uniref:UNC93-like protein MFSD11 n=1 Tax=Orchesella cincta TaxID=48709 RepID=A0A1D2NJI3_ORCCI|nr:UNC93-like protein MFSD11 [Orchesella cincta]
MRFNFKRLVLRVPKFVLSIASKAREFQFRYTRLPTTEHISVPLKTNPDCVDMAFGCCSMDIQFQNVLLLSFSFMLVFTSFQTMGNIEQTVLRSINMDEPSFTGNGYISLSIIYGVFSISNWVAPSIVAVLKEKKSMLAGAVLYTAFIASFLYPKTWLLYLMSAVLGIGAAVIWTAQGSYLAICSDETTMSRNSGVFWAILQSSMFFGNTFVFFAFDTKDESAKIEESTRILVFSVLTGVAIIGVICMLFLRTPGRVDRTVPMLDIQLPEHGAVAAFKKSLKLFTKKEMVLLSFTFFYTGIELSFFSGVYSTSVGSTEALGTIAKRLVGLSGILVGAGEVIGGALFGLLGARTVKNGRDPIVLLGFLCHTVAFYMIFINLPDASPLGSTGGLSYIKPPSAVIAMICSFLLGFGDACYNTQIYSILGGLFPDDSAPVFALFKFTQSAAAAASFYYSSLLTLRIQLGILQIFCFIGSFTFFLVEWASVQKKIAATSCAEEDPDDEYRIDKS